MDKDNAEYTPNEILFNLKKEILSRATTWINVENITICKIRQSQKDSSV